MNSSDYRALLRDAQTRARQLDTMLLTTASAGLGVLGFAASSISDAAIDIDSNLLVFGIVLGVSLPGSVLLSLFARPFVHPVPNMEHDPESAECSCDLLIHKCLVHTCAWSRMKRWCLVSSWLGLLYLTMLLAGTATSEPFPVDHWLYRGLAAAVAAVFLWAFISAIRLLREPLNRKLTCLLRRGHLIDFDGYQPRNCCTTPSSCMTSTARRPTSETRCDTPEMQ